MPAATIWGQARSTYTERQVLGREDSGQVFFVVDHQHAVCPLGRAQLTSVRDTHGLGHRECGQGAQRRHSAGLHGVPAAVLLGRAGLAGLATQLRLNALPNGLCKRMQRTSSRRDCLLRVSLPIGELRYDELLILVGLTGTSGVVQTAGRVCHVPHHTTIKWRCERASAAPAQRGTTTEAIMGVTEKIKEIEAEMARTQKNKATEYHIGLLRAKLAKLRMQLLEPDKKGGKPGEGFDVMKSGSARVVLIGFPSVGKSTLLSTITETESATAAYEYTTLTAIPGVLEYEGARIQLLDLPGIIEGAAQGRGRGRQVVSVAKTADLVMVRRAS